MDAISCHSRPAVTLAPTRLPALVPATSAGRMPSSASALMIPVCAGPRTEPPLRASPMRRDRSRCITLCMTLAPWPHGHDHQSSAPLSRFYRSNVSRKCLPLASASSQRSDSHARTLREPAPAQIYTGEFSQGVRHSTHSLSPDHHSHSKAQPIISWHMFCPLLNVSALLLLDWLKPKCRCSRQELIASWLRSMSKTAVRSVVVR